MPKKVVIKAVCIERTPSLTVGQSYVVVDVIRTKGIDYFSLINDKHQLKRYKASSFKYEVRSETDSLPN